MSTRHIIPTLVFQGHMHLDQGIPDTILLVIHLIIKNKFKKFLLYCYIMFVSVDNTDNSPVEFLITYIYIHSCMHAYIHT